MSTLSIENAPKLESTASNKASAKSSPRRRRKTSSGAGIAKNSRSVVSKSERATAAKMPPEAREPKLERITYRLQERPFGGLSKSVLRKLERLNLASQEGGAQNPISLKIGTRLVREWRGVTHSVLVHADGFEWNCRRYRSLTIIAREITGAHWSGPRFSV